jgi:hypothetical protein
MKGWTVAAGLVLAAVEPASAAEIKVVPFDIRQARGRADTVVLDTAGDLDIECAIHPKMRHEGKVENKKLW